MTVGTIELGAETLVTGTDPIADDLAGGTVTWRDLALCQQTDPEEFFPAKGGSSLSAKRICGRCDVKAECLEYALANDERFGVWGGLSENQRRKLRRG